MYCTLSYNRYVTTWSLQRNKKVRKTSPFVQVFMVHPLTTGQVPSVVGDHVGVRYAPGAYEVAMLGIEPAPLYPKTGIVPLEDSYTPFPVPLFCSLS